LINPSVFRSRILIGAELTLSLKAAERPDYRMVGLGTVSAKPCKSHAVCCPVRCKNVNLSSCSINYAVTNL